MVKQNRPFSKSVRHYYIASFSVLQGSAVKKRVRTAYKNCEVKIQIFYLKNIRISSIIKCANIIVKFTFNTLFLQIKFLFISCES